MTWPTCNSTTDHAVSMFITTPTDDRRRTRILTSS